MNVLRQDLQRLAAQMERTAPSSPSDLWRPRFHLAPPRGFLNDPNGLCRFREHYHVFYQYAPFDAYGRSVRFWGHYRSKDLLRWERCPVMLCPDQTYDLHGVYSGSALCREEGLYLYYTGNVKQEEGDYIRTGRESHTVLAFSPDGVHLAWKRHLMDNGDYPAGLTRHVRDPKVWSQDGQYYMVQGARTLEDRGEVLVFQSPDGLQWTHINTLQTPEAFGYMWECPDLFELDGQWVLLCSPQGAARKGPGFENPYACGYFPLRGDFRGEYTLGDFVPLDYGFDFYAPQTFSDGHRRLLIGWMGMPDAAFTNPTAERGWQHCLTVPRELFWKQGALRMRPVTELESLRGRVQEAAFTDQLHMNISPQSDILLSCRGPLLLTLSGLELRTRPGRVFLNVREGGCGRIERSASVEEVRELRILADGCTLEIYINDGEAVLSTKWYPDGPGRSLTLHGQGKVTVYNMRPMDITSLAPDSTLA